MQTHSERFGFDSPAVYQILIAGHVPARWGAALGPMTICASLESGKPTTTTLTGPMVDQAALLGILTELYDMQCTLLELRRLPESEAAEAPASPPDASEQ